MIKQGFDLLKSFAQSINVSISNRVPFPYIPLSNTSGALAPTNMATAPAPPVGLALPSAYTAISAATTIA